MKIIDFSAKADILLEDEEGLLVPMNEPYFRAWEIAAGTWKILSDGDYSYLLEGEDEALVIDSGYGAGSIRDFCRTLTEKPVRRIANTHDHFDHTANNSYFELAYMAAETQPLATLPFPSFSGITFPRDYPIQIVGDGDIIPLKGRDLLVIKIPDHAVGSIAFLDKKARILFAGDEIGMPAGKTLNGSVERWASYMKRLLACREDFDTICAGFGIVDAGIIKQYYDNAGHILSGHEGTVLKPSPFPDFSSVTDDGRVIWKRRFPHPGDGPKDWQEGYEYKRLMEHAGCRIIYDIRKIKENN